MFRKWISQIVDVVTRTPHARCMWEALNKSAQALTPAPPRTSAR